MVSAEAEPRRRCRSTRVEELAEAVPGRVRAGRPRSRGGLHSWFVFVAVGPFPIWPHSKFDGAGESGSD